MAFTNGHLDYLVVPAHTQRNHLGEEESKGGYYFVL
jgi:hypothetical protein